MKKAIVSTFIALMIVAPLAAGPAIAQAFEFGFVEQEHYSAADPARLLDGLWHGMLAPYSLIARIFGPFDARFDVDMYAGNNSGWFYDLGFLAGVTVFQTIGWIAALIAFIVTVI